MKIKIKLTGEETDDGRIYVTSPALPGFHYILDKNDNGESLSDSASPTDDFVIGCKKQ